MKAHIPLRIDNIERARVSCTRSKIILTFSEAARAPRQIAFVRGGALVASCETAVSESSENVVELNMRRVLAEAPLTPGADYSLHTSLPPAGGRACGFAPIRVVGKNASARHGGNPVLLGTGILKPKSAPPGTAEACGIPFEDIEREYAQTGDALAFLPYVDATGMLRAAVGMRGTMLLEPLLAQGSPKEVLLRHRPERDSWHLAFTVFAETALLEDVILRAREDAQEIPLPYDAQRRGSTLRVKACLPADVGAPQDDQWDPYAVLRFRSCRILARVRPSGAGALALRALRAPAVMARSQVDKAHGIVDSRLSRLSGKTGGVL